MRDGKVQCWVLSIELWMLDKNAERINVAEAIGLHVAPNRRRYEKTQNEQTQNE